MVRENNYFEQLRMYAFFNVHNKEVSVTSEILQEEILLIVGTEQHSPTYGNKLMFPAQAVREVKQNYKDHKHTNILIFSDLFTSMQLSIIKRDAKKWNKNLYMKRIKSTEELIDYINNGDTNVNRSKYKIGLMKIFSHGYLVF